MFSFTALLLCVATPAVLAGFKETSNGTVYEFIDHEVLSATDAAEACETKGGKLAEIETMAMYNRIRDLFDKQGYTTLTKLWVGGNTSVVANEVMTSEQALQSPGVSCVSLSNYHLSGTGYTYNLYSMPCYLTRSYLCQYAAGDQDKQVTTKRPVPPPTPAPLTEPAPAPSPAPTPAPTAAPTAAPTPAPTPAPNPTASPAERIFYEVPGYDKDGNKMSISVKEACLYGHNKVRKLHQDTPPLEYDDELAESATAWALEMARMKNMEHSSKEWRAKIYGDEKIQENIAYQTAPSSIYDAGDPLAMSPAFAVFRWYKEEWEIWGKPKKYDYTTNENWGAAHFTQMVWRDTTQVGCGVAVTEIPPEKEGGYSNVYIYVAAHYRKAGNCLDEEGAYNCLDVYKDNVRPLKEGAVQPASILDVEPIDDCVDYGKGCSGVTSSCSWWLYKALCTCSCAHAGPGLKR